MYLQGRTAQAGGSFREAGKEREAAGSSGKERRKRGRAEEGPLFRPPAVPSSRPAYRALPKKTRKYQVRFMKSVFSMASESEKL